jgi:hypothetical protein
MEPFKADMNLIALILNTKGLTVEYQNPTNGKFYPLNKNNMRRIFNEVNNKEKANEEKKEVVVKEEVKVVEVKEEVKSPVIPPTPVAAVEVIPEPKTPEPVNETKTETVDDASALTVVLDTGSKSEDNLIDNAVVTNTTNDNTPKSYDNSYKKDKYKNKY